jgi:hypothetical protein
MLKFPRGRLGLASYIFLDKDADGSNRSIRPTRISPSRQHRFVLAVVGPTRDLIAAFSPSFSCAPSY